MKPSNRNTTTMTKNYMYFFLVTSLLWLTILQPIPAQAQNNEDELLLSLSRDFGYSSGTGRIQGTFSMKASGPEDLERVVFYID